MDLPDSYKMTVQYDKGIMSHSDPLQVKSEIVGKYMDRRV